MQKKIAAVILFGILSSILVAIGFVETGGNSVAYKKISAAEAKAVMESTTPFALLDVRTQQEYQDGHIEGARLIPHSEINNRAASELPDKNAPILIYCRSGRRSAIAAKELLRMGYAEVYDFGGINSWPYGVTTGKAQ